MKAGTDGIGLVVAMAELIIMCPDISIRRSSFYYENMHSTHTGYSTSYAHTLCVWLRWAASGSKPKLREPSPPTR